jgi:hypothetical protein
MNRTWFAVTCLILVSVPARSDTITIVKNLSYNGTLLGLSNGVVTLEAHFPSGIQTMRFRIDSVRSIEFNSAVNNGPPPKTVGIGPAQTSSAAATEAVPGDIIVLRGNDRRICKLVSIDTNSVFCAQQGNRSGTSSWARGLVLRVQVGTQ